MRSQKSQLLILSVYGLLLSKVKGDIPVNCTYEEILGDCVFHIGEDGHDRNLNCTGFGNDESKFTVIVLTVLQRVVVITVASALLMFSSSPTSEFAIKT